jgi:hypothetical protein
MRITGEEQFWNYLESLQWRDRSDHIMAPQYVRAKIRSDLNNADIVQFRQYLGNHMNSLGTRLSDFGPSHQNFFACPLFATADPTVGDKNKRDFLSHVIARGQVFFVAVTEDPGFAEYLLGETPQTSEFQSLYDCIPLV